MPHTKQQLQTLLEASGLRPRHKWGQNFLIDLNLMRLLVDAAGLRKTDTVLEVGCGTGSLTDLLAERAGAVIAVDVDADLMGIAKREWGGHENITFILADALRNKHTIEPAVMEAVRVSCEGLGGRFLLVANLPYQIAAALMMNLVMGELVPAGMFVTVQAEVGDRMAAGAGSKAYGPLSILLGATGEVEWIRRVNSQSFWPRPEVASAMIAWRKDAEKMGRITSMSGLKKTVELLLGHRRKKIRTCLAGAGNHVEEILEELGIDADARGETLGPEQFVGLGNRLFG